MSEMPGQRQLLNICFTCLRYSRVAQNGPPLVRAPNMASMFMRGQTRCSHCRYSSFTQGPGGTQEAKTEEESIATNPFFEKYKQKLQHLAESDPEDYKWRLQQLMEEKKPRKASSPSSSSTLSSAADGQAPSAAPQPVPRSASYTTGKGLDSVMKLELVQDKSAAEVEQIWKEYHKSKDCVFAVLQKEAFEDFMTKGQSCPTFIYPLPRDDGHEFILMQFDGKDLQFTPLAMYQMLRENAPACLTLTHYTELMDSKGIVLMSGQYDDKVLKREEAVMLVQMMTIYYGRKSPHFQQVETFNHSPEKFDYNQLILDYRGLYLDSQPAKDASASSSSDKKQ